MPPGPLTTLNLSTDDRITGVSSKDTQQREPSFARSRPWSNRVSKLGNPLPLSQQQCHCQL